MPATAEEQLLLELINEARIDPVASASRYITSYSPLASSDFDIQVALTQAHVSGPALKAMLDDLDAVAPLAWNDSLATAAGKHSLAMIAADTESNRVDGEVSLGSRLIAEGYDYVRLGENVNAYAKSVLEAHASLFLDWGTNGLQSPPSDRNNIMWSQLSEVGLDVTADTNPSTNVGPLVVTEDFGDRIKLFVLGVAYDDTDNNHFYSVGEGRGDLTVRLANTTTTTTSADSGGYAMEVTRGERSFIFSGGGLSGNVTVKTLVEFESIKLDIVNGDTLLTTNSVDVTGPISVIRAMGVLSFGLTLTAGAGDQEIYGYTGRDTLNGGEGNDKLFGGDNRDTLNGGIGEDQLTGGAGDDTLDGGTGKDIAIFSGKMSSYSVTSPNTGTVVVGNGVDGFDTITNVEVYRFSDGDFSYNAQQKAFVAYVNDAPAVNGSQSVAAVEDTPRQITVAATDANGDVLTYTVGDAAHGSVSGGANGVFTYTPDADYNGADSFTVTVSDAFGGSAQQVVSIDVAARNDAPVVDASQTVTIAAGGTAFITVTASDVDGDTLTYSPSTPLHGTVTTSDDGVFVYTPASGFAGTDAFTVLVNDGHGGTTQHVVNVNVDAAFRLFASDGFAGTVAGTGTVFGTNGFQDITLADHPGLVTFDASFNRGGDIIRFSGDAADFTIGLNGSAAVIDSADATYVIPVGEAGISLVFDDGARKLAYSAATQKVTIGTQVVDAGHAAILAPTDPSPLPGGVNPNAEGRLFLGAGAKVSIGGDVNVVGTPQAEEVTYLKGDLTFDPSFNQGGDTIHFGEAAQSYSAYLLGSALVVLTPQGDVTVPIGTAGLTFDFDGDARVMRFDTASQHVFVGTQEIDTNVPQLAVQLDALALAGSSALIA